VNQEGRRSNQVGSPCFVLPVLRVAPFAPRSWHPVTQVKARQEWRRDFQTLRERAVPGKILEKCVGVLVMCVLVFTVFCVICTVFLYSFVYVYLFLFVLSVLL
jgi:hypothetical protein